MLRNVLLATLVVALFALAMVGIVRSAIAESAPARIGHASK